VVQECGPRRQTADPVERAPSPWRGQAYHRTKQIARMVDDYQAFLTLQPEAPEAPALKVLLASLR